MSLSPVIFVVLTLLLAYFLKVFFTNKSSPKHFLFPPGPKGLPIIGNTLDFPTKDIAQEYARWGKEYKSDILHASAFGKHVVFLNKREDADELFERRAAIYSDRPHFPIADLLGFEYNFGFMEHGEKWRMRRKICQQTFRRDAMSEFHPLITQKVHQLLRGFLDTPEKFMDHNKMLALSIPLAAMYAYELESVRDPCVAAADESMTLSVKLIAPGGSMINILPILRHIPVWFPGASSRKIAAKVKTLTKEMQRIPLDFVKAQVSNGITNGSLVSKFLEKKYSVGASKEEEMAILDVASTVYGGASDTIISTTGSFMYLMGTNQEAQQKAQTQIDAVIGRGRLPTFEDRPKMPYIEAIYRELLRWKAPAQAGAPHRVIEDDVYKGYFIPKGAAVFGNVWAMTHDEAIYLDPMSFKPERFLNSDGSLNNDDRILAYGFGRRVCVGKHMASDTLWLTIVSILCAFNIGKATDKFGNAIELDGGYEDFGIVVHKKAFECSITPRGTTSQKLVENSLLDG